MRTLPIRAFLSDCQKSLAEFPGGVYVGGKHCSRSERRTAATGGRRGAQRSASPLSENPAGFFDRLEDLAHQDKVIFINAVIPGNRFIALLYILNNFFFNRK